MMPARRAVCSGSPFLFLPDRTSVTASADIVIRPRAIASRAVAALAPTSTMRTAPVSSTWVRTGRLPSSVFRLLLFTSVPLCQEERETLERHRQVRAFELHASRHLVVAWREVEDRLHTRRGGGVHRRLRRVRRHRDDRNPDRLAPDDAPEVLDVVDEDAAARPPADLF